MAMADMEGLPGELVFLHATDVHAAFDNVARLKTHLQQKQQRIDVVLLSGDLANFPMEKMTAVSQDELKEQHQILDRVVSEFLPLAKQVFYIPGNHDVITSYHTTDSLESPVNVHLRHVTVAPHLSLVAIGGSVPGYRNGEKHWDSFPYSDDSAFAADLDKVLNPVFDDETVVQQRDAVIVMTHNGPDQSSTTVARADPSRPIHSGSAALYTHLCKETLQKHVLLNIHGHTHDAPGASRVGKTTIINPGALVEERYGIYSLTHQASGTTAWKLASIQLLHLPTSTQ